MPEQNSRDAALRRVYQDALAAGLDEEGARVAVAIAITEAGYGGAQGDQEIGGSRGTFQFYFGGGMGNAYAKAHGLTEAEADALLARDPHVGNRWALGESGYLGQVIREGQRRGLHGADLATYAQRYGQRSVSPERSGANYQTVSTDVGGGDSVASNPPTSSPGNRMIEQVNAVKGQPISVVTRDPEITNPKYPEGPKIPNPAPVYRLTYADGTYLDVRTPQPGADGAPADVEIRGGTALGSAARAAAAAPTTVNTSANEPYIVTRNPDGSLKQEPNPNYVAPKEAKPPNTKQVVTRNGKSYIYDPDTNTFTPASGLPDETKTPTTVSTSTSEPYIVRANPDGTLSQTPNPNYVAPKPDKPVRTTHVVGGRIYTTDADGNVVGTADVRTPQQIEKEGIDLEGAKVDLAGKRQDLLPKQQQILQGHLETVKYVQGMLERNEIDQAQADAYVAASKAQTDAALRGATPFLEMKEKREAEQARQRMGTDLLTQRLSSGAGLASSLLSSATSLAGHAMLRPGQTSLGVDPLSQLMPILAELQGGADVTPFARALLMGAQQGPPGVPAPLPAGL